MLLDVFSFAAVYAPTAEIGGFIVDEAVQDECVRYVRVPRVRWGGSTTREPSISSASRTESRSSISSQSTTSAQSDTLSRTESGTPILGGQPSPDADDVHDIPHSTLITLYTSLRQGLPLRQFVLDNLDLLKGIDIRRLITFGIIKGFLYRVHKYAVLTSTSSLPPAPPTSLQSAPASTAPSMQGGASDGSTIRHGDLHYHQPKQQGKPGAKPSMSSTLFSSQERGLEGVTRLDSIISGEELGGMGLARWLDGRHCFDEICVEVGMGEKGVEERVRKVGEVQVFSR